MIAKRSDWLNGAIIIAVLAIVGAYFLSQLTGDVGPRRRGLIVREAESLERQQQAPARDP
jgi:hypothetical protein